ncbi:hypothetical protein HYW41_03060 [Candidatus Daviesbacteria bacterium]|nr:hypothetical protein [Candidatus Daviesbacteria bacterium]
MEIVQANWKKIVTLLIILAGLSVGLYLVKHPLIFKPKATNEAANGLSGDFQRVEDTIQDEIPVPTFKVNERRFKVRFTP